ncbi:MAG: hypothetical protein JW888_01815 [Pirellulales bacterium]|nr:hypothetical protein [Pirellulales bacterium]
MESKPQAETLRVLLIENETSGDSPVERLLIQSSAAPAARGVRFVLTFAGSLGEALTLLNGRHTFDIALLDSVLNDATYSTALARLQAAAPDLPIVVLDDRNDDDDEPSAAAIRHGAQDWIPKKALDASLIVRTIRHAISRHQMDVQLRRQIRSLERARSKNQRQTIELRARTKELDAINRELDDFVYVVSHDLKEPIRGIRAYCELFEEDYGNQIDSAGTNRLRAIMAMCDRLEGQITDLLTYYRIGRMRPSTTAVNLTEVVDGQVAAFRPMLDRRKASVRIRSPLPKVHGHPVLFGMVFGNLISNGLKYNRSERPLVEIGTVADQPCTLYVRDNGIGIDPEYHEDVFAIFRRLHGQKEFEGSGAGLTIVRKIIQNYGGRIWLESQPGRGTTFFFSLPPAVAEPTRPPHWLTLDTRTAVRSALGTHDSARTTHTEQAPLSSR